MPTTTKLTLLVIVSVAILTAIAVSTITPGGNLAYAKKKSCNETKEIICQTNILNEKQTKILSNEKYLLGNGNGNETATRSDHGENDSNIVDEQISADESEIQLDNSTSTTPILPDVAQPEDSPFSLPTM
jgi:hypothetical protein